MAHSRDLWIIGGGEGSLADEFLLRQPVDKYDAILHTDKAEADVTNWREIDKYIDYFMEWQAACDQVDIAYFAGVNRLGPIGELDYNVVDHHFDVNVMGFIGLLNAVQASELKRANIVAVVSDASRTAMRTSIAYCASKAALAHAVRCGARELAPKHRVNGVSPSVIAGTPMTAYVDMEVQRLRGWTHKEALEYEGSLVPMRTRVTKQEVTEVITTTLDGPWFQTGSIIDITGGK